MRIAPLLLALSLAGALMAGLSAPAAAQQPGGTLMLVVTEVDESGEARYWWTSSQSPQWTATDAALRELLHSLGMKDLDPGSLRGAPAISQVVYGHPHLTPTNAINLASLFGASRVLTGTVTYESAPAAPLRAWPGARVRADLHVFATNTTVELLPLSLEEVAWAPTAIEAHAEARRRLLARLGTLLEHSAALDEVQVGVETGEPVLVLTGLRKAAPLVEIKRQLASVSGVNDVSELWAAEGVLALEINPATQDDPALVTRAIDATLRHNFEGFILQEVAREPLRIELTVIPREPLAPMER